LIEWSLTYVLYFRRSAEVAADEEENYLAQIEATIGQFRTSSEQISAEVLKLKAYESFNSELEKVRDEIYALKMLITSTRDIANEIRVAVNFTHSSFIQLRAAADLAPSLTTTATFYLQTAALYQPVAYLYNASQPAHYLALTIQNGRPHLHYRLSDTGPYTTVSTDGFVSDNQWRRIDIERVGRLAKLSVHDASRGSESASVVSADDSVVFNLDPSGAKFLLGQYPKPELLPVELQTTALFGQQFLGAIDDVKLNGQDYGLWSYEEARQISGEPKRSVVLGVEDSEAESTANGFTFGEDGFMCLDYPLTLSPQRAISVTIRFRTHASSGLLWSWWEVAGDENSPFLALYLEEGHVNFVYGKGLGQMYFLREAGAQSNEAKMNDNEHHTVFVKIYVNGTEEGMPMMTLLASETLPNQRSRLIKEASFQLEDFRWLRLGGQCIGGLPDLKRQGVFKSPIFDSFRGCISQLLVPGKSVKVDLQEDLKYEQVEIIILGDALSSDQNMTRKPRLYIYILK